MEIKILASIALVCCCSGPHVETLESYSGTLPLLTLSHNCIITTNTNNLGCVQLCDEAPFHFIVDVIVNDKRFNLIGREEFVSPKQVVSTAGVSKIDYQCGEIDVCLSFISPDKYYGCSPVNYLEAYAVSLNDNNVDIELNVEVDTSIVSGGHLRFGTLPTKDKRCIYYFGFESIEQLQLLGQILLPIWKESKNTSINDIISCRDLNRPSKGPTSLRIMKAKLNLSKDDRGNLVYVTCNYVNRMSEISEIAHALINNGEVELLKGIMNPIFKYAESKYWNAPFCPPDLGAYPLAMHRITDDTNYVWVTTEALRIVSKIDSLENSNSYSRKHRKTIEKWENYAK